MLKINPYILGDVEPALFVAAMFFAAIGILVILLLGSRLRKPNSDTSPEKFSWRYLINDNAKRIYGNIVCVLVTLRFMPELFNVTLTPWMGFVIGLFWDSLFLLIKQKTKLLDPSAKKE